MKHPKGLKFNPEKSPNTMCYVLEHDTFDIYCNKCGCPVLKSETDGYIYQCMNCDEDLYSIETHKGEHHTDEQFNQLCLDTEALLELDYKQTFDDACSVAEKEENELLGLQSQQNLYAASIGGLLALREADETWNDFNRDIIKAFARKHPRCVLGSFYATMQTPYTGQKIYNFGCDFILPEEDEILRLLIEGRLLAGHTDMASIMKVQNRIKTTGGIVFIWK